MAESGFAECPSFEQLEGFLDSTAEDDGIRSHVAACLHCQEQVQTMRAHNALLSNLLDAHLRPAEIPRSVSPGQTAPLAFRIPGYEMVSELHRGGQGVVYSANQTSTKRKVAVKILLQGTLATSAQRNRWAREIELVAGLRHPNIVTVYESGLTEEGLSYLAMEYIDGLTLDDYLRSVGGTTAPTLHHRLRLAAQICAAITYAHQRGVIHRDLKPNNILITSDGQPHVLDFGLAKVMNGAGERDAFPTITAPGEFVGTLAYASPEQTLGDPSQLDTRSDVYSFGVILYEMLTGHMPYTVTGALSQTLHNVAQAAPAPPRSWFHARDRHDAAEISPLRLDDEIETVLLKALSKEKERRYQSAAELGKEIDNYLNGRPIDAKRDSAWYLLRKTVRRHRGAVWAATVFVLFALGYAITMSVMYQRAAAAEQRAHDEARKAEKEANKSKAVNSFLLDMLESANPEGPHGPEVTLRTVLDEAAGRIGTQLADHPEVKAGVHASVGNAYRTLGLLDTAEAHLRIAADTAREWGGEDHLEYATALNELALLLEDKGEYEEAEHLLREAVHKTQVQLGREHPFVIDVRSNLGSLLFNKFDFVGATVLFREALAADRKLHSPDDPELVYSLGNLAASLSAQHDYDTAEALNREALAILHQRYGDRDHPHTAQMMSNLAKLQEEKGDYDAAVSQHREIVAMRRRLYSADHPDLADSLHNLGASLYYAARTGNDTEAEALLREALAMRRRVLGDDHPHVAPTLNLLGLILQRKKDFPAAEPLHQEALTIRRKVFSTGAEVLIADSEGALGACLTGLGRYDEAEPLLVRSYPIIKAAFGADHPRTRESRRWLTDLYDAQGRPNRAPP